MKRLLLIICLSIIGYSLAFAQLNLQLEAELASDFSNYYGEANCTDLPAELVGMSVYRLFIRANGEEFTPQSLWGNQQDVMEFIPYGVVYNSFNPMNTNCNDLDCDTGWGTGGPIPWLDTWISMGGMPDGASDGVLTSGCCLIGYDNYSYSFGTNLTANAFLQLPSSVVLPNPTIYPLGQTMTTAEGAISLVNITPYDPYDPNPKDEIYVAQIVTDGPMVVRVNFTYWYFDNLFENRWDTDPGLEISFGYCFDPNACNYSPDFDVVGIGYEFCEYNSCTPCGGCMEEEATNYNPFAEVDNGTCIFPGCTNPDAENYDPIAYEEDGSCILSNGACAEAYPIQTSVEPILVGINEGDELQDAQYCWSEQPGSQTVWFSFEAFTDEMYVLSEPLEESLLDVVVLDACDGGVLSCAENTNLFYSALTGLADGQEYYVGFRGEPGVVFELSVGGGLVGCDSQFAINFDPDVDIDFGCEFAGCTDPAACNYWVLANIDDGSCFYEGAILEGSVYRDFNLNNISNQGERVPFYPITVLPGNDVIYTDAFGFYYYETTDDGPYTIVATSSVGVYDPEIEETLVADEGDCTEVTHHIRLISLNEGPSFLCQGFPASEAVTCVGGSLFDFDISNDGNVPITVEVTVTIDPGDFFDFVELPEGAVQLSANQFSVLASIDPAQTTSFDSVIEANFAPDSPISITYDVNVFDPNDELIASESYTIPGSFVCSFDPNNKLAFPEGYEEPEFIANERIHYTINFQNTGNYPAVDVLILDSLDLNVLDLSTFEYLESSHSHFTTLSEDGVLEFYFEDIYLPDSTSNEPESHGWVRFSIEPFDDLPHMTQIDNEALIYFDINEAVITNTVTHTIYNCGMEAEVSAMPDFLCFDDEVEVTFLNPYLDSTLWYIDGILVSEEESLLLPQEAQGLITLSWTGMNPLCTTSDLAEILVEVAPQLLYNEDTGELYTEAQGSYQWYDGEGMIIGATESSYLPLEDGDYYVSVTSPNGCEYQTDPMTITHVGENRTSVAKAFPNPTSGLILIDQERLPYSLTVTDLSGATILMQQVNTSLFQLDLSLLASGTYMIRIIDAKGERVLRVVRE